MGGGCGGWRCWVEKERDRGEKDKERGRIKNDKERIFKWSVKKNRSFDVMYIVKWCVIYYKVGFLDAKC